MTVVALEEVCKVFRVSREPSRTLKEAFLGLARGTRGHQEFVALDGVSLAIQAGEAVGIVGPNGSGKSTLFRVVSRILRPTSGRVRVAGRVAPLIELTAGFHPELTGIENLYLNGAVYGMRRHEVTQKIEVIRAFADIGDFIFSPVRVYSSGMMARLAFALTINVDAEVLLIDEALSVGDAAFRDRCEREIRALNARGVTVVFVSHDLRAVRDVTSRAIWLERGSVRLEGPTPQVVDAYAASVPRA